MARTDRTHVFTANYVYELPFFKEPTAFEAVLGGWQVAGITTVLVGPAHIARRRTAPPTAAAAASA